MEWTAAPDVAMWLWLWCHDAATNLEVVLARVDAAASSWPPCPAAAFAVAVAAADLKVLGTRHSMASRNEQDLR